MRLRPCIDIHDGKVKQIVGGSIDDKNRTALTQNFVSRKDAAFYADLYREKNLPGGHIILLYAKGTPEYEEDRKQALLALKAYPGGMMIGGGISPKTAGEFLDAGASHVIVTSYVFRDGKLDREKLSEMLSAVGKEHLVLDLSCRKKIDDAGNEHFLVVTDRWQKFTELEVTMETLTELSSSCDEFLIHAADVEGKKAGIEEPLCRVLGAFQEATGFPVTYAGGVHSLDDVRLLKRLSDGHLDFTVGSALDLFGGKLSLEELIAAANE